MMKKPDALPPAANTPRQASFASGGTSASTSGSARSRPSAITGASSTKTNAGRASLLGGV